MSIPTRLQDLLFSKDRRLHLLFGLTLLAITAFVLVVAGDKRYVPGALFWYIFTLTGIYTGRWLCRRWLLARKWTGLAGASFVSLLSLGICGAAGYIHFFQPGMSLNHVMETTINMTTLSILAMVLGFLIAVTRSAIREKINGLQLAERKKESELGLLRSQISPHFLFNTLHNLYSLSINRPTEMPDLLLRLAELLRYSIYEADQTWVSLREEINYLRNYVALENIRIADRLNLTMDLEEVPAHFRIAPMLLIVFVENAFKHARNTQDQSITITVTLKITDNGINFFVTNSCTGENNNKPAPKTRSGFGIANVQKRLDLLYPGQYSLRQSRTADQYHTELWLKAI